MEKLLGNTIIYNFVSGIYEKLLSGKDIPKLKFIFNNEAYPLFNLVKNNAYPNYPYGKIDDKKIRSIMDNNLIEDGYNIRVNNAFIFFEKLTELANLYANLHKKYENTPNIESITYRFIESGLWLRLLPSDFDNIYDFLDREISFLKNNDYFDKIKFYFGGTMYEIRIGSFNENAVYVTKDLNNLWFETFLHMRFKLYNPNIKKTYNLPLIHYEIEKQNDKPICYVYGIQSEMYDEKDKKIERSLYKLNKGISEPNIHPSFVLAITLFIDMLINEGITEIRVPLLEVLNYDYHTILSNIEKHIVETQWPDDYIKKIKEDNDIDEIAEYEESMKWSNKIIDREDFISKAKIENLANLFFRIKEQYGNIDIDVLDYMLCVRIKQKTKRYL